MKSFIFMLSLMIPILSLGQSYCLDDTKAYSESISFAKFTFKKTLLNIIKGGL